ncbi:unnamed protein product [Ectocarpus sp. 12 AP-2014]
MALHVRRLCTVTGLALVVGTKGFVHHPPLCAARGATEMSRHSASRSSPSPAAQRALPLQVTRRRPRAVDGAASSSWGCYDRNAGRGAAAVGSLFSVQQSVDGGVMLPPAEKADEYAAFLSESIREHLNDEWMEQDCHKGIGEEVARLYLAAFEKGDTDLTTLVLDMGSAMEQFDMGDAFVGAWDIANLVSDFLMEKMGAETSSCSAKAPKTLPSAGSDASRLTSDKVEQMQADLTSDFARYRFLLDLMEGNTDWEQANTIMAVYQGYPFEGEEEEEGGRPGVRQGWSAAFPGATPPDLSSAEGLVEALQADFPDDPDLLDGLEVIVETVYGGEAKRLHQGDPDNGVPPEPLYLRRSTLCKWLYLVGFLSDDIKRAPDDPEQLAELISGRARLKHQKK